MSRSIRKTPIIGHTCCDSEKFDKCISNRKFRRYARMFIKRGEFEIPRLREISNNWVFGKDGKSWLGEWVKNHPEAMRK